MAAHIWLSIIILCLLMYVTLDGYDLGIGTLSLLVRNQKRRKHMCELVATAWDGNESWLILLGVALWGGLPGVTGVALPAMYLPLIAMLLALILRGVAIEMISSSDGHPPGWFLTFGIGSVVAGFAQGLALGGLLSGVTIDDEGQYAGGSFDFFTPFSLVAGVATVGVYLLAGAAFLQLKTTGELRRRAAARAKQFLPAVAVLAFVTAAALPFASATPLNFDEPVRVVLFGLIALIAAAGFAAAAFWFGKEPDWRPMAGLVVAEVCGLLNIVVLLYPVVVPPDLILNDALAPASSLNFLVIGVGLNIPLVLGYSWYAHYVFRGKFETNLPEDVMGISAESKQPDEGSEKVVAS